MSRGRRFSAAEIDCLLEIVEEILPIGPNDWDRVTERHCSYYPVLGRTRKSLRRKFASLYNHKKPTGDPNCPVSVRNAKRIWERIKEEMDISDGEQGGNAEGGEGGKGDEGDEEDEIVAHALPPMDGVESNEDGENGDTTASVGASGGELCASGDASAGGSVAGTPRAVTVVMRVGIAGARVRTPRQSRAHGSFQSSNFSELMQFILMRAETESVVEQRRLQEQEDAEDCRRRGREETEDRYRREHKEAEERRERRIERQLQNQSDMMQVFMMCMMEGRMKRKKDDEEDKEKQELGHNNFNLSLCICA